MDRRLEKRFWTMTKIWGAVAISIFVIFVVYAVAATLGGKAYRVERESLRIEEIRLGDFHNYISFTAVAQPDEIVYIDAEEGGRIEHIFAENGDILRPGQPIMELSNVDLNLSVMNREASLAEQMNNLRNTRLLMEQNSLDLRTRISDLEHSIFVKSRELERNELLHERGHLSDSSLEESSEELDWLQNKLRLLRQSSTQDSLYRLTQIDQLEGSIDRMRQNLALVRTKLDNLTITASIAGQVSGITGEIGQTLGKGLGICRISNVSSYNLRGNVDERYVSTLSDGLPAVAKNGGIEYPCRVERVLPDVTGGTFGVEIAFSDTTPENIATGQSFRVDLKLGDSREALLLPRGSFFSSSGGNYVFVLNEAGDRAWKREIETGLMNREYYEVLSGLEPGERVIISSYDRFVDVDRLRIKG